MMIIKLCALTGYEVVTQIYISNSFHILEKPWCQIFYSAMR